MKFSALRCFLRDPRGATVVEYVGLAAILGVGMAVAFGSFAEGTLTNAWQEITAAIAGVDTAPADS